MNLKPGGQIKRKNFIRETQKEQLYDDQHNSPHKSNESDLSILNLIS